MELERTDNYRQWLQQELMRRCKENANYSIRAFAKSLGIDASSLSQVLSGKRNLSPKKVAELCDRIGVNPEQKFALTENHTNDPVHEPEREVAMDAFRIIANWYHYAIMELTFVDGGCKNNPKWISDRIGITAAEARLAIERLKRLELIEVTEDGLLKKSQGFITNYKDGVTSGAHKELQRQVIAKSLEAIDNTEPERKDITSVTMAVDESRIPLAKKKIQKFRRDICMFLQGDKPTTVFNFGLQLYPISKPIKGKKK